MVRGRSLTPVSAADRGWTRWVEVAEALREIEDPPPPDLVRQRARFIEDYDHYVEQVRIDLGKLFRIEDDPSKDQIRDIAFRSGAVA